LIELIKKVRVHPLFWLVIAAGIITGHFKEVLMVFVIVFVHEMGHSVAAYMLKWDIKKMELLPFGGAAQVEENGTKPIKEEMAIVLAGPLQHLWLWALSFALVGQPFWSESDHELFVAHNAAIVLFNLLPIYPLDGGRMVQLACLAVWPYKRAMAASLGISVGFLAVALSIMLFLPFHLNLFVILSFLALTNGLEFKQRNYRFMRFLMAKQTDRATKSIHARVSGQLPIRDALALLRRGQVQLFVIEDGGNRYTVAEKELLQAYFAEAKLHAPVKTLVPPAV
jgi:stage IV sporulation protein FB